MQGRRILWITLSLAVLVPICRADELSDNELSAARKTYVAKCAKCHKFYEPKHYSDPEWSRWMTSMSRKSKLKPAQEKLLSRYLEAYRNGKIPAAK